MNDHTTLVKICGITNLADAQSALAAEASYLGMIFSGQSTRKIDPHNARQIALQLKDRIKLVGVFKDQTKDEILQVCKHVPLDLLQLHGGETPDFCRAMTLPVIKVIEQTNISHLLGKVKSYMNAVDYILFDRPKAGFAEDWLEQAISIIHSIEKDLPPYFFAGGLNIHNIKSVLDKLNPFAVDVAAGVEISARQKDKLLMETFCRLVHNGKNSKEECIYA